MLSFQETDNQIMIAQTIKDFGAKEMRPYIMEWDEAQIFPIELFRKMGELGLMGIMVPEKYNGSGFGYLE